MGDDKEGKIKGQVHRHRGSRWHRQAGVQEVKPEHKRNISEGQRRRWERKKAEEAAKDRVVEAARGVAAIGGPGVPSDSAAVTKAMGRLRQSLKELDSALSRN